MIVTRVVLVGWLAVTVLLGCASTPPATRWGHDLAAAKAQAGADRLVVVRFTSPNRPRRGAMEVTNDASSPVRATLAAHESVRLGAAEHAKMFRAIFDTKPRTATCVMDGGGLVIAARLGQVSPLELASLVRQAEDAYPLVVSLVDEWARLDGRASSAARRSKAFLLGEAFLLGGNPYAAYEYLTLVTLLAPKAAHETAHETARGSEEVIRACERLARIEIDRGHHREAREWLGQLHEEDGTGAHGPEVRLTEAMIAMAEQRAPVAYEILSALRTEETHQEADRVWFEFGRACQETGRDQDAEQAFHAVVDRFPESRWRAAAAVKLSHSPVDAVPRRAK
jgi:tetratricopeptide (TPR) repeat protein